MLPEIHFQEEITEALFRHNDSIVTLLVIVFIWKNTY